MSIALMTLAFKLALPSTSKFVLVALCDSANDQGECYPSVSVLMAKCSLSDRGVQRALAALEADGYLRRELRTGRSTVYWINPHPRTSVTPDTLSPPNVSHPTPERQSPQPPTNGHPTPDTRSPITINEPSIEPSKKQKTSAVALVDVSADVMADFQKLRTAKKSPLTATALAGIRREATKAGLSMQQAVEMCCERGWAGFKAEWLHEQRGRSPPAESFRERDQRLAKERYEEFVGIRRPVTDATIIEEVPDAAPRILGR